MAALPNFVCLKSAYNNKYLRYRYELDVTSRGLLQFAGEDVTDPYAQFKVEKAKSWDGLVHIKSCYTNKYWVRWSPFHYWISASAYAPVEDPDSWTCTLFKPIVVEESDNTKTIRLLHVQLGHYVNLSNDSVRYNSCLFAGSKNPFHDSLDLLIVVDWESIFRIPKHVAIKGDNSLYLGAVMYNDQPNLQFSFIDPKDPKVVQEIFSSPDGTIYIKSEYYGKFWTVNDGGYNWIAVDAEDPRGTGDPLAMFRLSVVDVNVVALLNMSNPIWYVQRLTASDRQDFLAAKTQSIDASARLEVIDVDK